MQYFVSTREIDKDDQSIYSSLKLLTTKKNHEPAVKFKPTKIFLWSAVVLSPLTLQLGEFSLGIHVPIVLALGIFLLRKQKGMMTRASVIYFVPFIYLSIQFVVANIMSPCEDSFVKSTSSFFLFGAVYFSLVMLAATHCKNQFTLTDVRLIAMLIVFSTIVEKLWLSLSGASNLIRPSGIYLEPSHLALSVTPFLIALVFSERRNDKLVGWGGILLLFMMAASSTMFILVLLCLIFGYVATKGFKFSFSTIMKTSLSFMFLIFLIYISPYFGEVQSRLDGVVQLDIDANISSIVYLNGWQTAFENFWATNGLGLGFNRMGCYPIPDTEARQILANFQLEDLNFNDGSFTFSKIVSELGVVGVIIWLFGIYALVKITANQVRLTQFPNFFIALIVSGAVTLFLGGLVRGTGYFSGPFIFGLYCFLLLMMKANNTWSRKKRCATKTL